MSIKHAAMVAMISSTVFCTAASAPNRIHGAILGKAMSALETGKGLVLVLVSLQ